MEEKFAEEKFAQWAIVEIFGHSKFAGLVTEQTIGGASFDFFNQPSRGVGRQGGR